jgi:cytochrome c oxidase subunit 4
MADAHPDAPREERRRRPRREQGAHETHASVGFYWMIAAVLAVITGMEVAIFYIPAIGAAMVPTLLLLSAAKFLLVVMFFMHLKFDSWWFSGLFLAGLSVAIFMVTALVVLYYYLPRFRT